MASTYSELKIELIGTGDQAGTWGVTTNTNLGTAIEEAITGSANVTFASSNVAIALTDTNATQTARNLRLNLVGTLANVQTLFVPAIQKQYLVVNGLSNSVVISNGSNATPTGSTVTIPAGKSVVIFNDGTNVAETINYVSDLQVGNLTLSNVTLTNPLDVAEGGTGRATLTANNVLLGNGTTAVNFVAPGASGNVLTSNGTTWVSQAQSAGITTGKAIAMAMIFGF
jgi:hypothetical protein